MKYDFNSSDFDHRLFDKKFDFCIVGSGFAGISLARSLASKGNSVIVLEAGDFHYSGQSQENYLGEISGRSYFNLASARVRFFGGTSNHWTGHCKELDDYDFKPRKHIPYSGWPISKNDIKHFFDEAANILEIPKDSHDKTIENSSDFLKTFHFQNAKPTVRLNKKFYGEFSESSNIRLILNANVLDIELNYSHQSVVAVHIANYAHPDALTPVLAKFYVIACGGIENPRILLNASSQIYNGIGNDNDLIGRFFMEHFHALGGYYTATDAYWREPEKETHIAVTEKAINQLKIGNSGLRLSKYYDWPNSFSKTTRKVACSEKIIHEFLRAVKGDMWCPSKFYEGGIIKVACEQVPNPQSRVTLSDELDMFGRKRVKLDWRILPLDKHTIKESVLALGKYLVDNDLGSVKLADWLINDEPVPSVGKSKWIGAGWHHMGTTRMSSNRKHGVVDGNCKVFGVDNLYIAGSSVFTTVGHANPTVTIVQLALRLAQHLSVRV